MKGFYLFLTLLNCAVYSCAQSPTDIPTATPSLQPSAPVSEAIPTSEGQALDLPAWLLAENRELLLLPIEIGPEVALGLINAPTGEQFVIPITPDGDYFWYQDGDQIGTRISESELALLDLNAATVRVYSIPDQLEFSNYGFAPAFVTSEDVLADNFHVLAFYSPPSPNMKYFLHPRGNMWSQASILYDVEAEERFELAPVDEGYFEFGRVWSPLPDSALLGIVRARGYEGFTELSFEDPPDFSLVVYDVTEDRIVASYPDITSANWSPDGSRVLYQPHESQLPCILDLSTNTSTCFEEVLDAHSSLDDYLIIGLTWLADGESFAYIYFDGNPYAQDNAR